ncbi:MAG TPA: GntR family transcriptional regulator [Bacteroidales bacterium]|jgi:GntR family transcriptional regulator/GntR family frlABCD operon transcriptional regulator|nr:GntR family transcriptional regulator [Bacteroidales bacterium]HOX75204.1 GntR family transcriptional regulator [Bacteroidales bacterium]HPM87771.1 GntR family transcriptional regulator [Bacteroidales bacterium]HQM70121.1 GntR family transcriptional regulator [Bacteroidales bacterium]
MTVPGKIPHHRRLYEVLRKHIIEGVYMEGDLLPSENELCQLYGVTRPTVRQSLSNLANDGFISRHQGKGSIVHHLPREIGILSVSGTTSAVGDRNLKTRIIVKPVIIPWKDDFMFPLSDLEKESGCVYMERLRLLDDIPIFYDISYIANINLPRITSRKFENQSLFRILRDHYQIEIKGGEQRIKAIPASARISRFLQMKKGDPVLHLERKMETNNPGLFLYSSIFCNTEKYSIFGRF